MDRDSVDVHDGIEIDFEVEGDDLEPIDGGESRINKQEYTGSMEFTVENESDFTLGYLFGSAGECQESDSDTSVAGPDHRTTDYDDFAERINEPLENAYQRGVLDGLFLCTLLYTMYWPDGEYQESDRQ
jgi:hypothetical protein